MSLVFNLQRYSLHDGPGIRTIVFLKGCPMRCRWCCNPESQRFEAEISCVRDRCIGKEACGYCRGAAPEGAVSFDGAGKAVLDMERCRDWLEGAEICPSQAIRVEGKTYGTEELLDLVEQDAVFYRRGHGGLTVSGGEPLAHGLFLIALLKGAKERRLATAMETCGYGDWGVLREAAGYLDTVLFDIKHMDDAKHRAWTGRSNRIILENFRRLCLEFPHLHKRVRTPVIPGFNDNLEDIRAILDFLEGRPETEYEPLPYHSWGRGKYTALGRPYPMGDAALDKTRMEEIRALVRQRRGTSGM